MKKTTMNRITTFLMAIAITCTSAITASASWYDNTLSSLGLRVISYVERPATRLETGNFTRYIREETNNVTLSANNESALQSFVDYSTYTANERNDAAILVNANIMEGIGNGSYITLSLRENVTRAQFATLLSRSNGKWTILGVANPTNAKSYFSDMPSNHWAYSHVSNMYMLNIMQGSNNMFNPEQNVTVVEIAQVMYNLYTKGTLTKDQAQRVLIATFPSVFALDSNNGNGGNGSDGGITETPKPDTKPEIPGTKPEIPDTKPEIPGTKPEIPDTKPEVPETPKPVEFRIDFITPSNGRLTYTPSIPISIPAPIHNLGLPEGGQIQYNYAEIRIISSTVPTVTLDTRGKGNYDMHFTSNGSFIDVGATGTYTHIPTKVGENEYQIRVRVANAHEHHEMFTRLIVNNQAVDLVTYWA